jgi:hypothetical protein
METEAAAFAHEYGRDARLFILKPWNLGRSMDTAVVDSLPQALALARTCPKVACAYVRDTALVYGKKIDVRCVRVLDRGDGGWNGTAGTSRSVGRWPRCVRLTWTYHTISD